MHTRLIAAAIGLVHVVRPLNVVLTAISVLVGGLASYAVLDIPIVVAAVSASLIAAGGYVVNDIFDVEIDRINRPDRPLPRGDITIHAAKLWYVTLTLTGLIPPFFLLPISNRIIALAAVIALFTYAAWLKRTPLVGNLVVAMVSGVVFVYGGVIGAAPIISLVPGLLAFAYHLGREILKAAADRLGDEATGAVTVAVLWGERTAMRLAVLPLIAVILVSPLPTWFGWFGERYLIAVIVGINVVLAYVIRQAWLFPNADNANRLAHVLKWDMIVGLFAVGWDRWAVWF
jgi:geranylgeranylglycerol-phosphate geranylgeranyltransferase